jgi:hypothetical protein
MKNKCKAPTHPERIKALQEILAKHFSTLGDDKIEKSVP